MNTKAARMVVKQIREEIEAIEDRLDVIETGEVMLADECVKQILKRRSNIYVQASTLERFLTRKEKWNS